MTVQSPLTTDSPSTPWLTAEEAAKRARVGLKTIYGAARSGKLRAARVSGRRELRFLGDWVDEWLIATTEPIEASRRLVSKDWRG